MRKSTRQNTPLTCAAIAQCRVRTQFRLPMGVRFSGAATRVFLPIVVALALLHSPAARADSTTLEVVIVAGHLQGDSTLRVAQGDSLNIIFHADSVLELHLHGYDIETKVEPNVPATMKVDAKIAGRFAIEAHGHSHGGSGHRTLLYLEVHPH